MKYITTDKHPLGKGHTIQKSESHHLDYMFNVGKSSYTMYLSKGHFNHLLSKGEIKEVEEKEFTKSDTKKIFGLVVHKISGVLEIDRVNEVFESAINDWLKEREK